MSHWNLNDPINSEIPKEEPLLNIKESNKIIIENDISEFEKPEEPKILSQTQLQEEPPIHPEIPLNPTPESLKTNPPINTHIIIINNDNINININNNNNISNTNLTLITNTDPGYIASQSNNEISSIPPIKSKSKALGKKIRREYICEVETCKRIFHDKSSFRKHLLTHGEKLFICEICKKKFLDNSKLRRHSLVHSGEKPYACPMCPKRFSLDFNLRTHMRIHSGEKPYACVYPGCFKRFSQSSNLSAHEKTHEIMKKEGEDIIKPIFNENPIKYVLENPFSGMATLDNVKKINEIYEIMRKGIIAQMNTINLGNSQVTSRNHGELPGMPIQKRTYIKKSLKENNNSNNNTNIDLKNNLYENQNINTENNANFKSSNNNNRKLIFHINERDSFDVNSSELNNEEINSDKNQFLQPYKPSFSKRKLFATYRDPNRIGNYEIIYIEKGNSNNKVIDLSGKKRKQLNGNHIFDENNIENQAIDLIEDKDEQEKDLNNFDYNDKDNDNIENILWYY